MAQSRNYREGLGFVRLMMVLASLSPLFVLLAIRGTSLIPDHCYLIICSLMIIVPNALFGIRILFAKKRKDRRSISVGESDDHRSHTLVYLLSMLLPFYRQNLESWRDLSAIFVALAFIVLLFWRLNLYYTNILFVIFKYNVFTVRPPLDENPYTGRTSVILITKRNALYPGDRASALRLSDTVYLEQQI